MAPAAPRPTSNITLHFTVSDTGIGIPGEKLRSIFDPFVQADGSTTRKYGGTGLGLSICRNLVEMMKGAIWVESVPGSGSTFHFTAEFELPAEPPPPRPVLEHLRGRHALVLDDNATSCVILTDMLGEFGMVPHAAQTGAAALERLDQLGPEASLIGVVMLDSGLPESDSVCLVQQIRARTGTEPIVILMLSSPDGKKDLGRFRDLSAAGYVIKPPKHGDLVQAIQNGGGILADTGAPEEPENHQAAFSDFAASAKPLRILLVDDNVFNQKVGRIKLERGGHRVTVAGSGPEALDTIEKHGFDLVFMDMQMPHMDGLETTAEIRRREAGASKRLPVIALTAHASEETRNLCLQSGMDGYVSKPFQDHELWQAIRAVVPDFAMAPAEEESPAPVGASPAVSEPPKFNREKILDRVGGNMQLLCELAGVFERDCESLTHDLRDALAAQDPARVSRAAHPLKGMVGFFAADKAQKAAADLEAMGKRGDISQAAPAFDILLREIEDIQAFLKHVCDEALSEKVSS